MPDKIESEPKRYGQMWGVPVPWYAFIWPITQHMGEKSCANNPERKDRALAVSRGVEVASR